jgi:hypothetical protein
MHVGAVARPRQRQRAGLSARLCRDTLNAARYLRALKTWTCAARYVTAVGGDALSGRLLALLAEAARSRRLGVPTRFRAAGGLVAFVSNMRPILWPDAAAMLDWITQGYSACDSAFLTFDGAELPG